MTRVLHVIGSLANGGIESFLLNIYRQIDRKETQFDFLVGTRDGWCDAYEKEITEKGGKVIYIPSGIKGFYSFYNYLKKHPEYKIVHSHRGGMSAFFLTVAKMAGVPNRISHSHNAGETGRVKQLFIKVVRPLLCHVTTKRFSCGEEAGKYLYGKKSFIVIKNGIDLERYCYNPAWRQEKRSELGLTSSNIVFGHVGRFEFQKNHHFLIDIFNEITHMNDEARLLLIGGGSLKPEIEKKVSDLGLTEKVLFLEQRLDVNELLSAIDVVLFPSHYEGFSLAMVEMQASGLPILSSDSVPHEINLTKQVYFKKIEESALEWAKEAIQLVNVERKNYNKEIEAAGLDIKKSSRELLEIYFNLDGTKENTVRR